MYYQCLNSDCSAYQEITPLFEDSEESCPLCGSKKGKVVSNDRLEEGLEAGVFFNIDPTTGKRAKKKK